MLQQFKIRFAEKFNEITAKRERYTTGLQKLENAAKQVSDMQQKLFDLQPKLKQLSDETEQIMVTIERDTAEAEKKKEVVGADEAAANEAAAAAQAIKDDCDSDLQEAIPAFNAALAALNTLKPPDITIVKSMKNPPAAVKLVLEAVCVIRAIKPERKLDASEMPFTPANISIDFLKFVFYSFFRRKNSRRLLERIAENVERFEISGQFEIVRQRQHTDADNETHSREIHFRSRFQSGQSEKCIDCL